MPILKNSNATFWVIFKQCYSVFYQTIDVMDEKISKKGKIESLKGFGLGRAPQLKWKLRYAWISNWENSKLELRHLNCHNKSAANVSVLLWKQWGGLSTRHKSAVRFNLWHDCVTSVTRKLLYGFSIYVPTLLETTTASHFFLHYHLVENSSAPLGLLIEISPGDCLMESGSHPLSFTFPEFYTTSE